MFTQFIKHAVATCAAAATTLVLFSSVASLADQDKAALAAARAVPMAIAASSVGSVRR